MDLSNGPWKDIFKGDWAGYEIEVKENPDKLILTLIYEKERKGAVLFLNRFYAAQGTVSKLLRDFKNYSIVLEKQYPSHNSMFFSISTGPKHSKIDMLNNTIENLFKKIESEHERLNEKTKIYAVTLTELKYAKTGIQKDLFSDPLMLPGLLMGKISTLESTTGDIKVLMGKKSTGEQVEEEIQSFLNTLITGTKEQRKRAIHVILENGVLSGKTSFVFDYDGHFEKMNYPNKDFDYDEYKEIQPIGMPIKQTNIGKLKIDLNLFDEKTLLEVFGLDAENFIGKETSDLIAQIFDKNKGSIKSLEELEGSLMTITIEAKKFHVYRAIRWIRVLGKQYPEYFGGKTDLKKLIPSYVRSMGSIVRIDVQNQPTIIKKALYYSLTKTILKEFEEQAASNQIKIITCLPNAHKFIPANGKKQLDQDIINTTMKALEYGLGLCSGTESEVDLFHDLTEKASMKINFVRKDEVAIKERNSRPYRIKLRPNLSS